MKIENVTDIALTAGEILLGNGAETYRIEETVMKICQSYGFTAECLVMSNGLWLSVGDGDFDNKITSMKRVGQKHVDLYRIELINAFSRQLQENPVSYEEAKQKLKEIKQAPNFSLSIRTMAACMTGFIYTLFFNGSLIDAIAAVVVCFITYMIFEKISQFGVFQFLEFYLAGLTIGGASIIAHLFIPAINANNVITGAIMILIPGVVLTNGIKDVLYGDFISGVSKFSEAVIVIVAVSAGIGSSLFVNLKGM